MNLRKKHLIALLVFFCVKVFSQTPFNTALKYRLFRNEFPAQRFTVLVKANTERLKAQESVWDYRVVYSTGAFAAVEVNVPALGKMLEHKLIEYAEYIEPGKRPLNDTMVVRNRIKPVKQGQAPLLQAYNGSGVMVGIIDTGVDFNHPDFKNANGTTRVAYIWDQKPTSGSTVPQPFNYGIEWTAAQINASVCTHNDNAHFGHGTHVTGIMAGNGLANGQHEGCAPQADIVVVALDFNKAGPTIADAVQYLISKATQAGKPLVINASLGDYYGSHDGTDLEAQMIDAMITNQPGRVLVAAAGNAGHIRFHAQTNLTNSDTLFTWMENSTKFKNYRTYADTNAIKQVQFNVGANRAGTFADLGSTGFKAWNYGLSGTKTDTVKWNNQLIGVVYTTASINSKGVYELYVSIAADSATYKWRIESQGTGKHDAWNFDFMDSGLPIISQYPKMAYYVRPDTLQTIVSSFQCSDQVIVVANYENLTNYLDVNNVLQSSGSVAGKISPTSSWGPTRDGRQKPDVAATGNGVFSAFPVSLLPLAITNQPAAVSTGSMHYYGGGTSAASPVVAGLATLYLQKSPAATNQLVKSAITNCTYGDSFTGSLPNYRFGYGKLDGKAAFLCNVLLTDLTDKQTEQEGGVVPNPANAAFKVQLPSQDTRYCRIYDCTGRLVAEPGYVTRDTQIDVKQLRSGIYFVQLATPNGATDVKQLVIQQ